eukprot:GFKZ01005451.1.p1 GENE.GFKZ01005451.1~~GFKZ01005451.1.p1  ORF type:complete len:980 (-),score=152.46 GFKZ01005451.1:2475-5414(-)
MPTAPTLRRPRPTNIDTRTTFITPFIPTTALVSHVSHRIASSHKLVHLPAACLPTVTSATLPSSTSVPTQPDSNSVPTQPDSESDPLSRDIQTESLVLLEWPQLSSHVLRHTSTPLGRELLNSSQFGLPIPSSRQESERLLSQTREIHYLEVTLQKPIPFAGVDDILSLVQLASKGKLLTGKELVSIAQTLAAARAVRRHIEAAATDGGTDACPSVSQLPCLKAMVAPFRTWPEKELEIMRCLDDFGDVTEAADPELREVRLQLRQSLSDVRAKMQDLMARHSDAIQERVIMQRYDRFVLAVKMSRKGEFRRGIVHDASSTGSTAYIEPASVKPLNDRMRQLAAKEKARVNAVLKRLSSVVVAPILEDVTIIGKILAEMDIAAARARTSYELGAVDVVFDDDRPLKLLGARHPLLVWKAMEEEKYGTEGNSRGSIDAGDHETSQEPSWEQSVVPSSYELDENVRCICVTGPNTGGKTLTLKTLGICVLMAKAGLFVPAKAPFAVSKLPGELDPTSSSYTPQDSHSKARLPYFDGVLADIGDDQSLVQSLSTFSGHVMRIKRIMAMSTPRTLVLLDEIGSGTDPAEGAALGMAILRHLAVGNRARLTFATTHHGELKTLKYADVESARFFENASVEFDDVRMKPTYKLIWGIPGRSNALAIANRLGLSESVIEEARHLLTGGSAHGTKHVAAPRVDIEKMIMSLERDKKAAEVAREESERHLGDIERMRHEVQTRLLKLQKDERELRNDQRATMNEEIKSAKKQIARVIREMQKGGGSAQAANAASEKLRKLKIPGQYSNDSSDEDAGGFKVVDLKNLRAGDRITTKKFGQSAVEVVEVRNKSDILVSVGGMKAKVKVREILGVVHQTVPGSFLADRERRPSGKDGQRERGSSGGRSAMVVRTAANTIDIRGERVDGAQVKVEAAMDRAIAVGALWVIHGHGTGRLKHGIREFLKNHHLVKRMEDADQADGGSGVTVVFL